MVFSSHFFLFYFLPIVLAGVMLLPRGTVILRIMLPHTLGTKPVTEHRFRMVGNILFHPLPTKKPEQKLRLFPFREQPRASAEIHNCVCMQCRYQLSLPCSIYHHSGETANRHMKPVRL
jgi:hypothetical protein